MEDFKRQWDEWYGDVLPDYEWCELTYKGRRVLYMHGNAEIGYGGESESSQVIQVIGYTDYEPSLNEEERKEIVAVFKRDHGIDNVTFWSG